VDPSSFFAGIPGAFVTIPNPKVPPRANVARKVSPAILVAANPSSFIA
jgi:hypothetical protein